MSQGETEFTTVALSEISTSVYKNYRSKVDDSKLQITIKDIKANGLIQPPGGMRQPDGKFGLSFGFSRYEMMCRIATEKVIDEYNEKNGYDPSHPEFIALNGRNAQNCPPGEKRYYVSTETMRLGREKIREKGKEWQEKYDNALANFKIKVAVFTYERPAEAMLHNASENRNRQDASLHDDLRQFELMTEQGFKQTEIANAMNITASMATHWSRVSRLVPEIHDFANNIKDVAKVADDQAEILRHRIEACANEIDYRFQLDKTDPKAVSFRTVRECSQVCFPKDQSKKPPYEAMIEIFRVLARMDTNFKPTDAEAIDTTSFIQQMKEACARFSAVTEAAPVAAAAPAQAATATQNATATTQAGAQPISAAQAQPVADGSGGKIESAAANPINAAKDMTSPEDVASIQQAEKVVSDLGLEAGTKAANAAIQDATDENGDTDFDTLADGMADAINVEGLLDGSATQSSSGEQRAKTVIAPETKYRPMSPETIERYAVSCVASAMKDEGTLLERITHLNNAGVFYSTVGMDAELMKVNKAAIVATEQYELWLNAVTAAMEKHFPADVLASIKSMEPKITI